MACTPASNAGVANEDASVTNGAQTRDRASGMGGYRETVARLQAAQKPGRGAPPYSRWVNRRLGRYLAAAAYPRGLTPNQVTMLSALCTFSALVLVALVPPQWWLGLVVSALLVLGYALDAADGQLARLRGGGSLAGEWLDHVVDATKTCLLHSAVLISLFRFSDVPTGFLLVPLGYQLVASVFFFTFILVEKLRKSAGREIHRSAPTSGRRDLLQTLVAVPTDYGVLCLCFVVFGWVPAFLTVYTAMFAASAIVLAGALVRWWRELKTLDATS